MAIMTKDQHVDNFVNEVLSKFVEQHRDAYKMGILDEVSFDNLEELGRIFYEVVGDRYGDIDDAIESVRDNLETM